MPARSNGFTLLELMIVLVVAGLMLAVVPPILSRGVSASTLNAAASEIAAAMRAARAQAISHQRETLLTMDVAKRQYRISNKRKTEAINRAIKVKLDTVKSEQLSDNVGRFRFFPDGSATGGQVTLSGGKKKAVVDLNWLTGRVAIYSETIQ
jgi:general secretion pathway protein H